MTGYGITLNGGAGNDLLTGDNLVGGSGNDTFDGTGVICQVSFQGSLGGGADTLTGGLGADKFQFELGGGNDKVTDFVSGTDKVDLDLLAGVTSADLKIATGRSGTVVPVDANHDGRFDFTITLTGVTHVDTGDFIFA